MNLQKKRSLWLLVSLIFELCILDGLWAAPKNPKIESLPPFEASKEVKNEMILDSAVPLPKESTGASTPTSKAESPKPVQNSQPTKIETNSVTEKATPSPEENLPKREQSFESLFRLGHWNELRERIQSMNREGKSLTSEQRFMGAYAKGKLMGQVEAVSEYDQLFHDGYYSGIFYSQYLRTLYEMGRYQRAKQVASTLITREGRKPDFSMTLALIETQLHHYDEALSLLEEIKSEMNAKKEFNQVYVYIGERLKRPDLKLKGLKKLMWIEPENMIHARDFLHELSKTNDPHRFFNEAQAIRARFPKDPTINRAMARACRGIGKNDLARFYDKEATR